jgi:nucleoside-diphosphate-sugar epimerase
LIVGGGGYIGTHLVAMLLEQKYRVRVLDKLLYGKEPLNEFLSNPGFELVEGDATDISKLVYAMSGASSVVHLSGLVGDPACAVDEGFTRHANVIATRMVKEVAQSFNIQRLVFASSCSVYGATDTEVNEESALNPVSLYAVTKIDGEREILANPTQHFHATVLRFATVFGHSRRPRFDLVANLFAIQGMTDGRFTVTGPDQWRPLIHCKDVARAINLVLQAPPALIHGQVFNVGDSSMNTTIKQLGLRVQNAVQKIRPVEMLIKNDVNDRRNYVVSFKKIESVLGFRASITIDQGVEEIVKEYQKGTYKHYKDLRYNNVEITKKAATQFNDPAQTQNLYRPVSDVINKCIDKANRISARIKRLTTFGAHKTS